MLRTGRRNRLCRRHDDHAPERPEPAHPRHVGRRCQTLRGILWRSCRRSAPECGSAPSCWFAAWGKARRGLSGRPVGSNLPGEFVALKVLNPVLAQHPSRLAQFRREAERGARLAGPSLLHVIESGQVEGLPYLAMPFVEGITLLELIRGRQAHRRREPVAPIHRLMTADEEGYQHAMVCILSRAALALAQLHAGRVVHRDIKPANILIDVRRGGRVYLCDLGLGRDLEVATIEQMRDGAGTPMYMAPERLLRAPADEILCDLYSIGVTLFEALTLDRPFAVPEGLPLACLSGYLASAEPRRPRQLNPEIPAGLETVILRAMARNPTDRPRSALELAGELDQLLARGRVPARPARAEPNPLEERLAHSRVRLSP